MSVTSTPDLTTTADEPFGHPALFYRGLDEYLAGTLSFIEEGLAAGEPVAVAVPAPRLEPLRAGLGEAAHRVRFVDMHEAGRNPGRIIPGVLLDFADAHRDSNRVRIVGEPIWPGRSATEYPACVQHEALINTAFAGRRVTILCPYDADELPASVLADAEATHPTTVDAGSSRVSTRFAPGRIFDEYNRPLPEPVHPPIATLPAPSPAEVRRIAVAAGGRAGLTPDRIADFELAISELVTDSVGRGDGGSAQAPGLRIWVEDGHLVAELRGAQHPRDPLAGRRPVDPQRTWGRGLLLVNQLADLVRIHSGEPDSTIRMYLSVTPDATSLGAVELRGAMSTAVAALFPHGDPDTWDAWLPSAINGAEIHQATGMVLVQLGVSAADAFTRLRAYAVTEQRPLTDVAGDVVAQRLRFESVAPAA